MSSYAAALVSALIVVTLWFMSAAFLSARQGRTWRAILYLLVASLPSGWQRCGRICKSTTCRRGSSVERWMAEIWKERPSRTETLRRDKQADLLL